MPMKRAVKRMLWRCGWTVARASNEALRYVEYTPRSPLDDVLLRVFPALDGLCFIQIGAGDGALADPIAHLIDRYRWRGLLLEPLPDRYSLLRQRHGANPRLKLVQAALAARCGVSEMFMIRPEQPGLPDWVAGLPSLSRARLELAADELGLSDDAIVATTVETIDWECVVALFGDRRCDLLVIDAEGQDIELLRHGAVRRLRPSVIHFEHACVDRATRLGCYGELLGEGYELSTWRGDTVAYVPARATR